MGRKETSQGLRNLRFSRRYGSANRGEEPMLENQINLEEKSALPEICHVVGWGAAADSTRLNSDAALPVVQSVQNRRPQECGPGRPLSPRASRGTGTSCTFLLSWVHRPGHTQRQSSGTGACARAEPCDIQEEKGSLKTSSPLCQTCFPLWPHGWTNKPLSTLLRGVPPMGHATGANILGPII